MEVKPHRQGSVPTGYKQTEVGVIPKGWNAYPLGALTDPKRPISYGIVQTGPKVNNGVRCLRVLDVDNGRINKSDLITTSRTISDAYKRTVLRSGDLVMPLRGKVGDVALVDEDLTGCNLTRGLALIAIRSGWSASYCRQVISSITTRSRLEQSLNGSALQEIPIATLRTFKIPLPPTLREQETIAEALSDADALIESLEQLLTKKRQLKQGAMQELLTGKKRLPGFSGEWEVKQLGQLLSHLTNGAVYKPTNSSGLQVTRIETIADGAIDYSRTGTAEATTELENYKLISGDILFSHINSLEHIGKVAQFLGGGVLYHGMNLLLLRANEEVDSRFLYFWLTSAPARKKARTLAKQAVSQASINTTELKALEILLPSVSEQTAIAAILSHMDAEIAALEAKLAKARWLKQGMMQELLTGRIRLV